MQCPKCQFENVDGAKFCNECGCKLEISCPECSKINPPGSKFCNECGHNFTIPSEPVVKELSFDEKIDKIQRYLPKGLTEKILSQKSKIEGERRQVTIMFCDMKGSTPLTEKIGPDEAFSLMDQIYEILIHKVYDYQGTVNELRGDGILAFFGAPIALEDAPQRAIRSALAIHRAMIEFNDKIKERKEIPSILLRIGINTGPVVVGTVGNDLRVQFTAVGDTINMASRVENLTEPGTTYVTEETFKLTEGFFRFEALGAKKVKGKEKPISVYRVIGPSTRRTRFDVSAERGLTPFAGRERELELLLDGFERSKAGRGQAFSIISEAGVGKSRLLYEFRKGVASEDMTFLEGRCLSYSRGVAYHPIIDILKANFDVHENDGDLEIGKKVKKGLKMLGADEVSSLPYLLELLAVKDSGIDEIPMSSEEKKNRIIQAIKRIVLKGSEIRPLIMAFEDLHWIDKSSEDQLMHLLESIPGARVLLIFTYRPEFVHTWGAKSFHSQVNLNRLSNRESLIMVSYLLGGEELDKNLEEFILEKTEGIPFFIEELIKSLKDLKIIERKDNKYCITKDINKLTIPATIQDVIMTRIDSLPERIKSMLQIVSAAGREFSHDLIKKVTDLPEKELLSYLANLKDAELLYERGIYPQSTYIFKHALTQEVAYNSLLIKRKRQIHEKIGKTIEALHSDHNEEYCELLAYHYKNSAAPEKALKYLELASQKAARVYAMAEATSYFDEAMGLLDNLPETEENRRHRIYLLVKLGVMFFLLFKSREYFNLLVRWEPMAKGLKNSELLGAFYARLGQCEYSLAGFDHATQTLTKAIKLCEAARNFEDLLYANSFLMTNHLDLSNYDQVLSLKENALRIMAHKFNLRWYVLTLSFAARAYAALGRWHEAAETGKKAVDIAEEYSDNNLITFAAWNISITYGWKVDTMRAIEYGELAVEKAKTHGDIAWAQRSLGWAWCRAGEPKKGIDLLINVLPTFRAGNFMAGEIDLLCFLGEGYWLDGDESNAGQTLEQALRVSCQYGAKYYIGFANRLLGEISLKNNVSQAAPHLEKSIAVFQEISAENELALAYAGYGRLHKQQGQIAKAREYLMKALEIVERLGTLIEPDKVKEELGELP